MQLVNKDRFEVSGRPLVALAAAVGWEARRLVAVMATGGASTLRHWEQLEQHEQLWYIDNMAVTLGASEGPVIDEWTNVDGMRNVVQDAVGWAVASVLLSTPERRWQVQGRGAEPER